MNQQTTDLPEGTNKIIKGAGVDAADMRDESMVEAGPTSGGTTAASTRNRIREQVRSGRDKLADQAAQTARGLVSQGLERSSEALTNVSRLVADTAGGLEERLGGDYGDYARKTAEALERAAGKLAEKDPDELIDDARVLVQQSPGIAIAGAAIIGFALVRLVKVGLEEGGSSAGAGKPKKA